MYNRRFYLNALEQPDKAPRIFWMAHDIRVGLVHDPDGMPFTEAVEEGAAAGDVKPKTVKSWLYGAAKYGLVRLEGEYVRRSGQPVQDTRRVLLGDWPVPNPIVFPATEI